MKSYRVQALLSIAIMGCAFGNAVYGDTQNVTPDAPSAEEIAQAKPLAKKLVDAMSQLSPEEREHLLALTRKYGPNSEEVTAAKGPILDKIKLGLEDVLNHQPPAVQVAVYQEFIERRCGDRGGMRGEMRGVKYHFKSPVCPFARQPDMINTPAGLRCELQAAERCRHFKDDPHTINHLNGDKNVMVSWNKKAICHLQEFKKCAEAYRKTQSEARQETN